MPLGDRSRVREADRRLRTLRRSIGTDVSRLRVDAPTSISRLAETAGLDRTHVGRIEAGLANPSLEASLHSPSRSGLT